ncbi:MAG: hypothetical protein WD942_06905 [Dehalococcoidia bacterium]
MVQLPEVVAFLTVFLPVEVVASFLTAFLPVAAVGCPLDFPTVVAPWQSSVT